MCEALCAKMSTEGKTALKKQRGETAQACRARHSDSLNATKMFRTSAGVFVCRRRACLKARSGFYSKASLRTVFAVRIVMPSLISDDAVFAHRFVLR